MDNKTFYTFSSKGYLNTIWAWPKVFIEAQHNRDKHFDKVENLPWALQFRESLQDIEFPIEFIVQGGTKLRDVIDMRYPGLMLISDHIRNIFEENGLTGWKSYDVVVKKKNEEVIKGFSGFSVIGHLPEGWECNDEGIPDFFRVKPAFSICNQKVFNILKEHKYSVLNLKRSARNIVNGFFL